MSADPVAQADDGGRRPGRPALQVERITAVALSLVDEHGPHALTLRSLAARLGSSTATLYRHFADRSVLIDSVIDAVFGEVELVTDPQQPWEAALDAMATDLFEALERHRNITSLMLDGIPNGPNLLRLRAHAIALLVDAGFEFPAALRISTALGRYVLGYGLQTRIGRQPDRTAPHDRPGAVPPEGLADEFRFGLTIMIAGLHGTCPKGGATGGA